MRPARDDPPSRPCSSASFEENNVSVGPHRPSPTPDPDLTAFVDERGRLKLPGNENEKAASEWETEAGDDDGTASTKRSAQPNRSDRLAVQADDPLRRSTRPGHLSPEALLAHTARCAEGPFNSSSIYSTASKDGDAVDQQPDGIDGQEEQPPPEALWPHRSLSAGGKTTWSKTSSSVSMERFKYDRGIYSLMMSPVQREPVNQDAEVDWQTVTTERPPREAVREIELNFARGTRSSLADVSDTGVHSAQLDGISAKAGYLAKSTLDDFGLDTAGQRGQRFNAEAKPKRPEQMIQTHQLPARAAEAIRRFSNPFRQDQASSRRERPGTAFEMAKLSSSYQSLDSDPNLTGVGQPGAQGPRYTGMKNVTLDQMPPKLPSVVIDSQSNWPSFKQSGGRVGGGLPHRDTRLGDTMRLPFPLISLPEAAKLQSFRRERGQEDHTDPPGFFAAKVRSARSATVSTMSSVNSPMTPLSAYVEWQAHMSARNQDQPPAAGHSRHRSGQPRATSPARVRSSSPSGGSKPKTGRKFLGEDVSDTSSILEARILRLGEFALTAREIRAAVAHESSEMGARSEIELVETGRGRVTGQASRRGLSGKPRKSLRLLFFGIRVGTLVFPLIGILALFGHFDSTISWYSRGQRHSLLTRERFILKRQLLVEAIMYSILITALTVYYSVHGQRAVA
ncbi:hypothetical protein CDD80_4593 [Ophiocordyceps camponoti-rufipedis]|uniref:Uncharacterized protein n=1 Tax=Ophiocordyceps camponoti-rufipedis TaxID=2004952 RepID=A0A2C5Y2M5_9HYPO|nr:hypothetical protein CDD80_4593 [Ophiocordyceps camponoti-rufipedis]